MKGMGTYVVVAPVRRSKLYSAASRGMLHQSVVGSVGRPFGAGPPGTQH